MTGQTGGRRAPSWLAVLVALGSVRSAAAIENPPTIAVRLRSGIAAGSSVAIQAAPGITIVDRTPGARPATVGQGPASVGDTFTEEITLELPGYVVVRPTVVDVTDALVSVIRVDPAGDHSTVAIAVRQPVSYSVTRPSPLGEITVELRPRTTRVTGKGQRRHDPAVTRPRDPEEVSVDAANLSLDQKTNTLVATGSVTITRGDMTLQADEVRYDRTNGTADAKGHVRLTDPEGIVDGESAHVSIEEETGWVDAARTRMQQTDYSLACARLEKRGGPLYGVEDGSFTTCKCGDLERPSWSLKGRTTDIHLDGVALLKNATFRVLDVPVLWFPVFTFPANTDRQSGLLMPRIGYSKFRGFQFEQPIYWAISKSQDATVSLDVETDARLGAVGEYRYALSKLAKGELAVGYFNESIRKDNPLYVPTNPAGTPLEVGEHRFAIGGFHRQVLPGIGRFYLDMLAVSDDAFFREINAFSYSGDQAGNLRSRRSTTSRMGVLSTWAQGYLQGQVKYTQDLINPQELVAQELPRIEGEHSVPLLDDRVVARLAGNVTDYQRTDGYDGLRLHVAPDVFVPLPFGPYLSGSVRGRIRETGYLLTDNVQTALVEPTAGSLGLHFRQARDLPRLDSTRSQFSGEVSARLGTEVSRVYAIGSSGKLRHTIEPELQYLWVPDIARPIGQRRLRVCTGKPGEIPGENCDATLFSEGYLFDRDDAINERNFASWGVTTRLWWRETATPEATIDTPDAPPSVTSQNAREVFRATLTHGYDFSRRLVGRSHASDVDIGVQMSPLSWLSFRYDATVSLQQRDVRGQTVALSVREPEYLPPGSQGLQLPMQLALRYAFIENEVNKRADPDPPDLDVQKLLARAGSHAASANVYFRLGDYAGLFGSSSYDFNNPADGTGTGGKRIVRAPHFVDWSAYLRLISRCDCWSIDFGVYERTIEQPLDDRQFRVQFNLIGLGSFGRGAGPVGAAPNRNGILGGGLY